MCERRVSTEWRGSLRAVRQAPTTVERSLLHVVLALLVLGLVSRTVAAHEARFSWRMEPRFGLDADSDGLIDVPNSIDYVQGLDGSCGLTGSESRFCVHFDASPSSYEGSITAYRWEFHGPGTTMVRETESVVFAPDGGLPEGVYDVTLTIQGDLGEASVERVVPVEDFLLVAVGDSYASGEGNPERTVPMGLRWADDGTGADSGEVGRSHRLARRSTLAATAQLALALEQADEQTSVTFVFVAKTGATLAGGRSQLEEVARLVGTRTVDALFVSLGGNDAGFVDVLAALLEASPILGALPPVQLPFTEFELGYDYAERLEDVWWEAEQKLAELAERFASFSRKVEELKLDVLGTYITEYPELAARSTHDGNVERCDRVLSASCDLARAIPLLCGSEDHNLCLLFETIAEVCPALEALLEPHDLDEVISITREESAAAAVRFLAPLNEAVRLAAEAHDWTYVGGIENAFREGHGECVAYDREYAGNPFPRPVDDGSRVRWVRTAAESLLSQGNLYGTAHPNEYGHQAIKQALLDLLLLPVDVPALGIGDEDDQLTEAVEVKGSTVRGVLTQGSDVDLFALRHVSPGRMSLSLTLAGGEKTGALRVFDQSGTELRVSELGAVQVEVAGSCYIGVSGDQNTRYDPVTGLGDRPGGNLGVYELTIRWESSAPESLFRRGDCNDDSAVNVADVVCLLSWLFGRQVDSGCVAALNTNGDAVVDLADPVHVLGFLFGDGGPPLAPFPDCGPGELAADGEIGCTKAPACERTSV